MKQLRAIRLARGYTIRQMADRFRVSEQTWIRYEGLQTDPPPERREEIADFLAVTLDQLAGRAPFDSVTPHGAAV